MSVTLTYDSVLSRVRVEADGFGGALTATFERSVNGITWSAIRGGVDVPIVGDTARVDDYEFAPDTANLYRVMFDDTMQFVAVGAEDTDNNASVTPGLPAGHAEGDALFVFAAIRNSGTGTVNLPAGYQPIAQSGNVRLMATVDSGSETDPTVTFAGGVAGADTGAQILALRGVDLDTAQVATQLNGSGQDIAVPGLTLPDTWHGGAVLYLGWKQDDWTSAALATGTEADEFTSTAGSDMGMVWNWRILDPDTSFSSLSSVSFTITGGSTAISRGIVAAVQARTTSHQNSITPTLNQVWIKNLARPFLNRAVTVTDWSDVEQTSRNGLFDVVGRSNPVAVTDVRTSRRYTLTLMADTHDDAEELRLCLAGGDPVLLQVPSDCDVPSMYAVVGDLSIARRSLKAVRRFLTLPLVECATPGLDIVGATATYQTVLDGYATYADVVAAFGSYQELLELIAQPGEVIVS